MDKNRPSFRIKRHTWGERLIWRQPGSHRAIAEQLVEITGETAIPHEITVGYYRQMDEPPGAPCFMPVHTPWAIAALSVDMVQMRICEDLAERAGAKN